jgi:hypothetical protein
MKRNLEIIGVLIALAALVVAVLTWLAPFGPIGPSPLSPKEPTQTTIQSTVLSPTPISIQPITQVAPQAATMFVVVAKQGWQDTSITIRKDDKVTITYLSGTWSNCPANGCPYVDANGVHDREGCINCPDNVLPSCPHAALIAMVNDLLYCVRNNLTFIGFPQANEQSGHLQLRINDKVISDNDGSITVSITVAR